MNKLSFILILFLLIVLANHFLLFNISASMPEGLYWKSATFKRGDIVEACLSKAFTSYAYHRGYVLHGACHGTEPLVKRLIAVPHDHVVVDARAIIVNDKVYPMTIYPCDSRKRSLMQLAQHDYPDTTGYWLLGESSRSFDSRYFGAVAKPLAKLTPLLTW